MAKTGNRAIESIKKMSAGITNSYVSTDLGISRQNEETSGIMGATFGAMTRNILDIVWGAIGLDANVSAGYEHVLTDPKQSVQIKGRNYYPHPGIGNLLPYDESGNPSGGVFTLYTIG